MTEFFLVIIATVLQSICFALTKQYQKTEGTAPQSSIFFNAASGLLTACVFLIISGFRVELTWFSALMAFAMALFSTLYTVIGFQVIRQGGLAVYTTFLMSGGMLLPYGYGLVFLDETVSVFRVFGLLAILFGVYLSNPMTRGSGKKQFLLCGAVFVLNGLVSIVSKCHQIEQVYPTVSSAQFVMLSGIFKFLLCAGSLFILRSKDRSSLPQVGRVWHILLGSAVMGGLSYLLQLIGAENLPATVLYPLVTGGCILFSALADGLFFRARISRRQWLSIGLCLAGTLLFL